MYYIKSQNNIVLDQKLGMLTPPLLSRVERDATFCNILTCN